MNTTMNTRFLQFIFCIFLLAFSASIFAQVTIGSSTAPESGALLQLKDDGTYSNGETASKGLGLPRVELTDVNNLFPMFEKDGTNYKIGSTTYTKASEDATHIGLVVYNVNEDACASTPMYKGLYVWDGAEWQFLGKKEEPSPDVKYYTDSRAHGGALAGTTQVYPYRNFGPIAGDWMLENMRYIPDNTLVPANEQMTQSLGDVNVNSKYYTYPNQTAAGITAGTVPSSWSPNQGLLYTYSAATAGKQDLEGANQAHGSTNEGPATPIQGICPPNWHVPSDREWNELEAHIQDNMTDYSTETATQAWNPAWNITNMQSDNLATAMKSVCNVPTSAFATGGKSFSTNQGGFNVLLAGYAFSGNASFYGDNAFLWSSSSRNSSGAWSRYMLNANAIVYRYSYDRSGLFSVRCKKDQSADYLSIFQFDNFLITASAVEI